VVSLVSDCIAIGEANGRTLRGHWYKGCLVGSEEAEWTQLLARISSFSATYYPQELTNLTHWSPLLDQIDFHLARLLKKYEQSLLLIPKKLINKFTDNDGKAVVVVAAVAAADVAAAAVADAGNAMIDDATTDAPLVSQVVLDELEGVVNFLAKLLDNSSSKHRFYSTEVSYFYEFCLFVKPKVKAFLTPPPSLPQHLLLLLSSSKDSLQTAALTALSKLSVPPHLHRQQHPEEEPHTTDLHNSVIASSKLLTLARGWGALSGGLGMKACVVGSDSISVSKSGGERTKRLTLSQPTPNPLLTHS